MAKYCFKQKRKVLYLECLECENKICRTVSATKQNNKEIQQEDPAHK